MLRPIRIEGYAIVSADGMIADRDRKMPDGIKIDADARFFSGGLDSATVVVHGRNSHEQQEASDRRRRLVLTHSVSAIEEHPSIPNALSWNPEGASFGVACRAMGVVDGTAAVIGGATVFALFLRIGFYAFHLSRAGKVLIPGGRPVFPQVPGVAPEQVLKESGLMPGPLFILDAKTEATLVTWRPPEGFEVVERYRS
jgi:dihydrofolate reductase